MISRHRWAWLFTLLVSCNVIVTAQVAVLTHHNDPGRTGQNLSEQILNTSNVNATTFGKLFARSVDGQIYAQPLYVPTLSVGGAVRNVVYVATQNDSVYAFDADDAAASDPLWHVSLGTPMPSTDVDSSCVDITPQIGITSTPVIDPTTSTIYVVARTKDSSGKHHFKLHALDLSTGAEKFGGPVEVTAQVAGTGLESSSGVVSFDPLQENNRPGLLLLNGVVYIGFGSTCEIPPWHGWILGYNSSTLQQVAVLNTTPNGSFGGIWGGGQGLVSQSSNIYVMTGNGTFDADTSGADYADSFLKISTSGGLSIVDYFTPDNQSSLDAADLDIGSGGPMALPGTSLIVGSGKDGVLRVIDTNKMGHFNSSFDADVQEFQGTTAVVFMGAPIYWSSPNNGPVIYMWGGGDFLKAYKFVNGQFQTSPVSQSTMTEASGYSNSVPLSLSANGSQPGTGIVWSSGSYSGNANDQTQPGIFRAFDASDLSHELWDSKQNAPRDDVGNYAKFCPPTIANGKVYLGTFSNQLLVYGLLSPDFTITSTPSTQSVAEGGTTSYTTRISAQNGFSGTVSFNVSGLPTGATASFTPPSVTGSGSSQMTVETSGSTPVGTYSLTVTGAGDNLLSHSTGVSLTVTSGISAGSLSGSFATPSGTQNLTSLGTTDWAHWGLSSSTSFDHKATMSSQISNYAVVGAGPVYQYTNNAFGYSWTDGTPTVSASNTTTGVIVFAVNNGFRISVPADTTTRTLTVYVDAYNAQGKMLAHLSDSSAADYTDTTTNSTGGVTVQRAYTFTYHAATSGQNLAVTFTSLVSNGSSSNVALAAATLFETTAINPEFSLSTTPSTATIPAGQSASFVIAVTPQSGFSSPISLSCSGLPSGATCSFNPSSVTPNGKQITSDLTIKTTAANALVPQLFDRRHQMMLYALSLPLLGIVLIGSARRPRITGWSVCSFMLILLLLQAGCGSGGSTSGTGGDTRSGTYTITVTGSSTVQRSTTVTLKVQ